jgi:hypothetical protein
MTRGKHGAKAANRLAALDNQLLRDKCAEVDQLHGRVAELEAQLAAEKRERDALVLERAQALSAEELAVAHTEVRELKAAQHKLNHHAANWIATYMRDLADKFPDQEIIPDVYGGDNYEEILHHLVGQDIGEYLAIIFGGCDARYTTRAYRRTRRNGRSMVREFVGRNELERKRTIVTGMKAKSHGEETP